jgi:hypothetical protein
MLIRKRGVVRRWQIAFEKEKGRGKYRVGVKLSTDRIDLHFEAAKYQQHVAIVFVG